DLHDHREQRASRPAAVILGGYKGNATRGKRIALTRKPLGTFTSVLPAANPCCLSLAATIYTRHRSRTLFASRRITQGLRNAGTRMRVYPRHGHMRLPR